MRTGSAGSEKGHRHSLAERIGYYERWKRGEVRHCPPELTERDRTWRRWVHTWTHAPTWPSIVSQFYQTQGRQEKVIKMSRKRTRA